jgi:choline dehydrogenase-like flavoprotein
LYDYVIVGAGSAGCVLAARLSEDPDVRVALFEAGGNDSRPEIAMPIAFPMLFKSSVDWDLLGDPEPGLNDRRLFLPRGKVVGGCGSINAMIYTRGNRVDFDGWAADGAEGWSYDEVLPYFKRSEDNERGADEFHGVGGPLTVSDGRSLNPTVDAMIEAGLAAGHPHNLDFNGATQEGVGRFQLTQRDGLRCSTAAAFLHPALGRPNLDLITDAFALRIVFEGSRAVGIEVARDDKVEVIRAEREVILSAGAIASPHLLLLSGIGPAEHLQERGVPVVHDLAQVGRNLQDHFQARLAFRVQGPGSLNQRVASLWGKALMGAEFALRRTGPLTVSAGTAGLFARVLPGSETPDVQYHFLPFSTSKTMMELHDFPGLTISACQLRPESRGTITLASPDPMQPALIHANYLATETDRRCMVEGIKLGRRLAQTAALSRVVTEEVVPGAAAATDDDILAFIRRTGSTIYHPSGTCRMGGDPASVVDPELRVRGIEGLRVADAAVMPTVVSGNTNAPSIMIGEKCADMVKAAAKVRLAA